MVQQVRLAHLPSNLAIFVAMYSSVENALFLKDQLLAGNTEFEYAFIDASMVISTKHVLAATFRAINDSLNDRLKSRNVHSETVFSLSSNNNVIANDSYPVGIGEAFRRFGVSESTRNLLVLKISTNPVVTLESVKEHLSANIKGREVAFDDATFRQVADLDRIKKIYKLGSGTHKIQKKPAVNGDSGSSSIDIVDEANNLETQVIGLMALRGAT